MSRGGALALVGSQWGSEGKGVVAGYLEAGFDAAVRVGGPNAGHSLYHGGVLYKMRSVPCLWVNKDAKLFIGAGAVVNADLLQDELDSLPYRVEVAIDPTAVLITEEDEHAELATIRQTIGSTAEGVGEARVARMRRRGDARMAADYPWPRSIRLADVAWEVNHLIDSGGWVMLEGTQGSGLSLFHGTYYPYATSSDTNASGLASEAGIAPSDVKHVHLVARTFPIRVAGNSGPMGKELEWRQLVEKGIVSEPEQTTVTHKIRRISEWFEPVFERAVRLNQPCGIWLTFGDYLDPSIRGSRDVTDSAAVMAFAKGLEDRYDVPVLGVGTGPAKDERGQVYDFATARLEKRCSHGDAW